jgi:hypothetical protein
VHRLQAARRLLEETELAPKAIVFTRELGVAPADYRDNFQAPAAASMPRAAAARRAPAAYRGMREPTALPIIARHWSEAEMRGNPRR